MDLPVLVNENRTEATGIISRRVATVPNLTDFGERASFKIGKTSEKYGGPAGVEKQLAEPGSSSRSQTTHGTNTPRELKMTHAV